AQPGCSNEICKKPSAGVARGLTIYLALGGTLLPDTALFCRCLLITWQQSLQHIGKRHLCLGVQWASLDNETCFLLSSAKALHCPAKLTNKHHRGASKEKAP